MITTNISNIETNINNVKFEKPKDDLNIRENFYILGTLQRNLKINY